MRRQPVLESGLVTVRSKPPMNEPQLTPLALSRSPMFLPPSWTVAPTEHTSPVGSRSPTSVPVPSWPTGPLLATTLDEVPDRVAGQVLPATRFNTPGVEGPKVVP